MLGSTLMSAVPAEATPSGKRTPSCSTKDRTGKLPDTMDLDFATFAAAFQKADDKKTKTKNNNQTLTAAQ